MKFTLSLELRSVIGACAFLSLLFLNSASAENGSGDATALLAVSNSPPQQASGVTQKIESEAMAVARKALEKEAREDARERVNLEIQQSSAEASIRSADAAERQVWVAYGQTFLSLIGAVIAVIGALFLIRTFRETKRTADAAVISTKLAESSLVQTQRAFVGKSALRLDISYIQNTNIPVRWGVGVQWENFGTTAAVDIETHVNFISIECVDGKMAELPDDFSYYDSGEPVTAKSSLGPHAHTSSGTFDFDLPTIEKIANTQLAVFLYGWYDYNDIFENTPRRRTEFCFRLMIDAKRFPNEIAFVEEQYGPFNGVDERAYRPPAARHVNSSVAEVERAYVWVDSVFLEINPGEKVPARLHYLLANHGRTPAFVSAVPYNIRSFALGEIVELKIPLVYGDRRVNLPSHRPISIFIDMLDWSEELHAELKLGRKVLFFRGRVDYKDVFNEKRSTDFLYSFDFSKSPPSGVLIKEDGTDRE